MEIATSLTMRTLVFTGLLIFSPDLPAASCRTLLQRAPHLSFENLPINQENYVQIRRLRGEELSYEALFGRGFIEDVLSLERDQVYLDIGAGSFFALRDYRLLWSGKAQVIGIEPTLPRVGPGAIKELAKATSLQEFIPILGKTIEQVEEIPPESVDVTSDGISALSYAEQPDEIAFKIIKWGKVGSRHYVRTQEFSNGFQIWDSEKSYRTNRRLPAGSPTQIRKAIAFEAAHSVGADHWLKKITGIEQKIEPQGGHWIFSKTRRHFSVPRLKYLGTTGGRAPYLRHYVYDSRPPLIWSGR